jgi:4-amino-4-deoxy-L-arabinose transferase-like glycosyltransferase
MLGEGRPFRQWTASPVRALLVCLSAMKGGRIPRPVHDAPRVLGLALAAFYVVAFVGVALVRLRYPFALEWIEGGMLDEVRWLLSGHDLYVRPSLDYVPFIYNPLYFWICAGFAKVLGTTLLTLRLVSLASSLGTLLLLYSLVVHETQDRAMGLVAAGLYAGTFQVTQQFMDIARVDALFVLLAIAPLWVLRTRPTARGRLIAAALLVLCFLTKQTGALVAAPFVIFVLRDGIREATTRRERMRGVPFAALVIGGILGSAWLLEATSHGWYGYYAFELPQGHPIVKGLWWDFWAGDLAGTLGAACLGALFVLFGPGAMPQRARELWGAALAGVLLASWAGRLHDGGWTNVLMPAYALLAALFAIALHSASSLARSAGGEVRRRLELFVALVGLLQLATLLYDPRRAVPDSRDEAAGVEVVATLRAAPGDTFTPTDSYLAGLAGKRPYLHEMAVRDILRAPASDISKALHDEIRDALRRHRWAMLITDDDFFAQDVVDNYKRGPESVNGPDAFFPVTGMHVRPGWTFTPK